MGREEAIFRTRRRQQLYNLLSELVSAKEGPAYSGEPEEGGESWLSGALRTPSWPPSSESHPLRGELSPLPSPRTS